MKRKIGAYYGNKCTDCGVTHDHVSFFDLHHVDPTMKEDRNRRILDWGWERVQEELQNCVFLCPSCHRIRHIEMGDYADMKFYDQVDIHMPTT